MPDDQVERDKALIEQAREAMTEEERKRVGKVFSAFHASFNQAFAALTLTLPEELAAAWTRLTVASVLDMAEVEKEPVILPNGKPLRYSKDRVTDDALLEMVAVERRRATREGRPPNLTSVAKEAHKKLLPMTEPASIKRHINRLEEQAAALAKMPSPLRSLFGSENRDIGEE